jgi:HKD family nuclease
MSNDFLEANDTRDRIVKLIRDSDEFCLAVAYWGRGAMKQLGLDKLSNNQNGTIICDLMSGACNPYEIEGLLKLENPALKIRTLDGFHAKVYWTPRSVIVGSSNASGSGLSFEGDETAGFVEGNIQTDDNKTIRATKLWLEKTQKLAKEISDGELAEAKKLWKERRARRPLSGNKTFVESLKSNPEFFYDRNIEIWIYNNVELDGPASKALKKVRAELQNNNIFAYQDVSPTKVHAGTYVFDYPYELKNDKRRSYSSPTLWRILKENHIRKYLKDGDSNTGNLALHVQSKNIEGLKITPSDRKELKKLIDRYLAGNSKLTKRAECEIKLEELCKFLSNQLKNIFPI